MLSTACTPVRPSYDNKYRSGNYRFVEQQTNLICNKTCNSRFQPSLRFVYKLLGLPSDTRNVTFVCFNILLLGCMTTLNTDNVWPNLMYIIEHTQSSCGTDLSIDPNFFLPAASLQSTVRILSSHCFRNPAEATISNDDDEPIGGGDLSPISLTLSLIPAYAASSLIRG